jgi:hypothetical protein
VTRLVASAIALAAVASAGPARADDAERAEGLFQRARELMGQGDFATACPMLEESYSIDHGAGTLLALALCHEGNGKPATALREYRESLAMAVRANRSDRVMLAESHVQLLEASVPRIKLRLPSPEPRDLTVTLDGAPVDRAAMIAGMAVDPGAHEVAATTPTWTTWRTKVAVASGSPPLVVMVPAPPSIEAPRPEVVVAPAPTSASSSGLRLLGWSAISLGAIGVGVGTFFGISAFDAEARSKQQCTGTTCNQTGFDLNHQARSDAIASDVGFAAGGAALVAGLYLLLRAASSQASVFASAPSLRSGLRTSPARGALPLRAWARVDQSQIGIIGPW